MNPRTKGPAHITGLAVTVAALALLAFWAVVSDPGAASPRVGWLLAMAALVEGLHAQRRERFDDRRRATGSAIISLLIALALINASALVAGVLRYVVAGWFALDAVQAAAAALRGASHEQRRTQWLVTAGAGAVTAFLLSARGGVLEWGVAIAGTLRILGIVWNILSTPIPDGDQAEASVLQELGLADMPVAAASVAEITAAERSRAPVDRSWSLALLATLFAIHLGRMRTEPTLLGAIGPAVAVAGDMLIAVLITLLVFNPSLLLWRRPTRWIERRAWAWYSTALERPAGPTWATRLMGVWLRWRLRLALRLRAGRYSIPAALERALQTGLPVAAILAATVPVWGMSWYFDTENWAAGIWNSWAESRTDTWREAMARAVVAVEGGTMTPTMFAVAPSGVATGDFSFIVIGDPGEGDASQHVLRDRILAVAGNPAVRFVVISSDVIYPAGSMNDYEAKFWLPFKGVRKPVYAIPGNHDWYDALEGFLATFLEPNAARASMNARVEADKRVSSTTDRRIEGLVAEAARLREEYGVPTGFQRAPFFEIQSERFALLAIDTGVVRDLDPVQSAWLDDALDRARGKLTMAVLGHPFYAGGLDTTGGAGRFFELKRRLLDRGVTIVMAGDTHDLEYYAEPRPGAEPVHYFVNGGGGAYLSFGTALAWPEQPATAAWAYYPASQAVRRKIHDRTPWWKRPVWWWTDHFDAWPVSPEWLSAAFDYNVAPFFQSFVEVRVEPSAGRVRLLPHGVHGQLSWRDVARSAGLGRTDADDSPAEWVVPLPQPVR